MGAENDLTDALEQFCELGDKRLPGMDFRLGEIHDVPEVRSAFAEVAALLAELPSIISRLPGTSGLRELNHRLAELERSELDSDSPTATDVVLTAGAADGLSLLSRSILCPGDRVAYAVPSFPYWPILEASRIESVPIMFNNAREYRREFASRVTEIAKSRPLKAVILNEPHNPFGVSLASDQRNELRSVANNLGFWLLHDDVTRSFSPQRPTESVGDRSVRIGSFSKRYASPGLRLGWLTSTNPQLLRRAASVLAAERTGVSAGAALIGLGLVRRLQAGTHIAAAVATRMSAATDVLRQSTRHDIVERLSGAVGPFFLLQIRSARRSESNTSLELHLRTHGVSATPVASLLPRGCRWALADTLRLNVCKSRSSCGSYLQRFGALTGEWADREVTPSVGRRGT